MRLATFNILHGRSLSDRPGDELASTERLAGACVSLEADVLALQEVDRGQARSGSVDQTAEVARRMGTEAWRFEPAIVGEPGAVWRAAVDGDEASVEAGYGISIISRRPVKAWRVVRLPAAPLRSPVFVPGGGGRRGGVIMLADEPRVALVADFGSLLVATTHLSFVPGYNLLQLRRLTRRLAALGKPCILAGDLNVPGPAPAAVTGWRPLARVKTFPADRPVVQLDHVLAYGAVPLPTSADALHLGLSDHRAVVVDLPG